MKTLNTLLMTGLLASATFSAQANDGFGWSVSVGTPSYYATPIRQYRAAPVVVYDAPVVVYQQSPQVVVLPNTGYANRGFGNSVHGTRIVDQHFYGGQVISNEPRHIYRSHQGFQSRQGERCDDVGSRRSYHRGSLYGTSGWR